MSSNELQPADVDQARTELQARHAFEVEQRILGHVRAIRTAWIGLAADLFQFQQADMWRDLGYRSFEQWLASPDIELGRRHVYSLIEMHRELVINRGVQPEQLGDVSVSKVQQVLPAVRRGQVPVAEALSDARTLEREDLRVKSTGSASPTPGTPDTSSRVHTEDEPQFAICNACGSRYQLGREAA